MRGGVSLSKGLACIHMMYDEKIKKLEFLLEGGGGWRWGGKSW